MGNQQTRNYGLKVGSTVRHKIRCPVTKQIGHSMPGPDVGGQRPITATACQLVRVATSGQGRGKDALCRVTGTLIKGRAGE